MSCLERCPYFRGVLIEGFHCSYTRMYKLHACTEIHYCTQHTREKRCSCEEETKEKFSPQLEFEPSRLSDC